MYNISLPQTSTNEQSLAPHVESSAKQAHLHPQPRCKFDAKYTASLNSAMCIYCVLRLVLAAEARVANVTTVVPHFRQLILDL